MFNQAYVLAGEAFTVTIMFAFRLFLPFLVRFLTNLMIYFNQGHKQLSCTHIFHVYHFLSEVLRIFLNYNL